MKQDFKAAIFDMDGTLLDSMPEWRGLNISYVRSRGVEPTPEQIAEMTGMPGSRVVAYFKEVFGLEADYDELLVRAGAYMEHVYEAGVAHKPGAAAYLSRLGERGVLRVVATATPERLARIALDASGLTPLVDHIFSTDMIGLGKNDPAFFQRLGEKIGVAPEDCAMFEDSLYAMRGARAAGLAAVVGILDGTNLPDQPTFPSVCDAVVASYDELP